MNDEQQPTVRPATWDDVRQAYFQGYNDCGAGASFDWQARAGQPWHPDNPRNHIQPPEHEWRTDQPEEGRWVVDREGEVEYVDDPASAALWEEAALGDPEMGSWRYMTPDEVREVEAGEWEGLPAVDEPYVQQLLRKIKEARAAFREASKDLERLTDEALSRRCK
jgi:hypothetical protein